MQLERRSRVLASAVLSVAAAVVLVVAACGPTHEQACGPGTCMGCCDSNGLCQTGIADTQCGRQGASCEACAAGTACNLGICAAPQGCNGCLDGTGACVAGTSNAACGGNSEVCVACASNELCVNRACQKICKDLGIACTSDAECCDGRCSFLGFCSTLPPDAGSTDGGEEGDGGTTGEDGGSGSDAGMGCGDPCVPMSGPMAITCNPCAAQVCAFFSSCCTTAWDSTCVTMASLFCTAGCGLGFDAGFPGFDGGFPSFDGGFPWFDGGFP
ncbi:MAG: hypothetical protein IRZ16_05120 [Myxococcaceae bacterium]|nr:hypothetical protein [Myxococcaceae bacterium]